ncbi:MAG: NHL repeat containing protein [candidate division CPR1 bacterium GW2011_GWA2_42_17]|uniref:NHL repeat containing protein n=1 Tax=candidate division CPR1 bacterium GW2011_GWA2_42_17 TaxID=1618341 RepID=A0A0G0Z7E7_9BACT|nr:MAG: NHL repeat containing protein [candidate division CPR1 bacterium GW2011_GWA2_42_17]
MRLKFLIKNILASVITLTLILTVSHSFSPADGNLKAYSTGTWTQTDWSSGSGQTTWSDETEYDSMGGDGVFVSSNVGQLTMRIFASVAIGQQDLVTTSANQGGSVGANTLNFASTQGRGGSMYVGADGKIFLADTSNNRVLIYNSIPTADNASADVVVGQPNMTSNTANNGGIGANTLKIPTGVYSDGTKLYVSDTGNHRVLIYNSIPTADNASADVVVGQPNMTSSTANGIGADDLASPYAVYFNDAKLYITDLQDYRISVYNSVPTSNGASADEALCQPNPDSALGYTGAGEDNTQAYYNSLGCAMQPREYYNSGSSRLILNANRIFIFSPSTHTSTLTSSTFDSGIPYTLWGPLSYTATTPANTSVSFEVSTNGGSSWQTVSNYTTQTFGPSQTLIYRATLTNTDGISTPTLNDVSVSYAKFENVTPGSGASSSASFSGSSSLPQVTPSPEASPTLSPQASPTPSLVPSISPQATTSPSAQPSPSVVVTPAVSALQQQLDSLISQLTVLLQQRKDAGLPLPAGTEQYLAPKVFFQRDLFVGSVGDDVKALQQFLNSKGFKVAEFRSGSSGKETTYFGLLTKNALLRWQSSNNLIPTGILGAISRGMMNR